MEKRLTNKVQQHIDTFKTEMCEWLASNNYSISDATDKSDKTTEFNTYIGNYRDITFEKEDFLKRKRVKNAAPQCDRCIAKRANGSQCTRRKKDEGMYCGTHSKGTPHGIIALGEEQSTGLKKVDVWTEDFKGIHYYIDSNNNVYDTADIMENKTNPRVVAQWVEDNGKYTIPSLGI